MCETHCQHESEPLCSCAPLDRGNAIELAAHISENMEQIEWSLTYNTLERIEPYRLCMVGRCHICGGRLCVEQKPFEGVTKDDFLSAAYWHLHHFHLALMQPLPRATFRDRFVEMFRKEDRAAVETWLARPENQSIRTLLRKRASSVYTIVHSWADADQGEFPPPSGMASFSSREEARKELAELVAEEKETMEIPFSAEEYREEYGEDFWEAYRDGYAAGWFTRYEIVESPLYEDAEEKKGCAADDGAKADLL